jgi:uncharacterized DUF497 family protein
MFEYDPGKSAANLAKHGIDFETAQAVWKDPHRVLLRARSETEPRFALIAVLGGKHWTAFASQRDDASRIISVRRSRPSEIAAYEERRETQDD